MFPYMSTGMVKNTPSHGLVFADNYSTAVQRIIEYFGEENNSLLRHRIHP